MNYHCTCTCKSATQCCVGNITLCKHIRNVILFMTLDLIKKDEIIQNDIDMVNDLADIFGLCNVQSTAHNNDINDFMDDAN